ncbi:MAG: PilZ domain-containing protein [Acidobacteriota bacterium]|nr:PilZ domain-containing protein [Acidobacteriota bacterium]
MSSKNPRRNPRFSFAGKVTLSWEQGSAHAVTRGTAVDICQSGCSVTVREPIPVGTYVGLSPEPLAFRSSASVRHIVRGVGGFKVGLELSEPVPARALNAK